MDDRISHVGMYIGDGLFVHAPSTGYIVTIASLSSHHYRAIFAGATKL